MPGGTMVLLKGTLDVLILKTLSWGALHGYGVSRSIRMQTGSAFDVEEGALYPALRRLEKRGLLRSEWGRTDSGRDAKFYTLTSRGTAQLEKDLSSWARYVEAMASVLEATGPST